MGMYFLQHCACHFRLASYGLNICSDTDKLNMIVYLNGDLVAMS